MRLGGLVYTLPLLPLLRTFAENLCNPTSSSPSCRFLTRESIRRQGVRNSHRTKVQNKIESKKNAHRERTGPHEKRNAGQKLGVNETNTNQRSRRLMPTPNKPKTAGQRRVADHTIAALGIFPQKKKHKQNW
ncbi:unnamed protein product [Cuscuta epithymum]|uniref:Secreted protein n=1 Tax=Cuscuta epithymum TaxID=186058 RepID=A0AAV0FEP5_9ASTE|nr:unnamed protein product [Cuscuta epithymum]